MPKYYRKIIRITAEDSPNVRLALAEIACGRPPSNTIVVPGVLPYEDFVKRQEVWDEIRKSIGLWAEFWEGPETLMYPVDWLNRAEWIASELDRTYALRTADAVGIDPGEGGDPTALAAIDHHGVIEIEALKTPDTNLINGRVINFVEKHRCPWEKVCYDRGGGGKQLADRMRAKGYPVHTVSFGEPVALSIKRGLHTIQSRRDIHEEKYTYKDRRAEMYWALRLKLDPANEVGFGIPARYTELRRQLAPIPIIYNPDNGKIELIPKNKKGPNDQRPNFKALIGCSPDQADAVVVALHILRYKPAQSKAGAF